MHLLLLLLLSMLPAVRCLLNLGAGGSFTNGIGLSCLAMKLLPSELVIGLAALCVWAAAAWFCCLIKHLLTSDRCAVLHHLRHKRSCVLTTSCVACLLLSL